MFCHRVVLCTFCTLERGQYQYQIQFYCTNTIKVNSSVSVTSVPSNVLSPVAADVGTTFIFLHWTLPGSPNGLLTGFILYKGTVPIYTGVLQSYNVTDLSVCLVRLISVECSSVAALLTTFLYFLLPFSDCDSYCIVFLSLYSAAKWPFCSTPSAGIPRIEISFDEREGCRKRPSKNAVERREEHPIGDKKA